MCQISGQYIVFVILCEWSIFEKAYARDGNATNIVVIYQVTDLTFVLDDRFMKNKCHGKYLKKKKSIVQYWYFCCQRYILSVKEDVYLQWLWLFKFNLL